VIAAQVPSTPAAPTKKTADTTQITLSWVAPANRGSAITGYAVHWNGGGSGLTYT